MTTTQISAATDSLRARLGERVLTPDDERFAPTAALVIDGPQAPPALVVRPRDADDVALAVTVARDAGLPIAVRNGGHSFGRFGWVEDGLVLDLRLLADVDLDAAAWVGRAGGGTTAGAYTAAAGELGLATGFGDTGGVGVAGLTLGGGLGYLSRRDGLTLDNLLAADVVLADGRQVHASPDDEPDLFWALRGGGGNFGVVTRLHLRLVPQGPVYGGVLIVPLTARALADVVAVAHQAPEELTVMVNALVAPPLPFLPETIHGKQVLMLEIAWSGDVVDGDAAVAPLRALGPAYVDTLGPQPYPALFEGGPSGPPMRASGRTGFLQESAVDEVWAQRVLDGLAGSPAAVSVVGVRPLGGAIARVPADATAFAHRAHDLVVATTAMAPEPAASAVEAWSDTLASTLGLGGPAYANFLGTVGEEESRRAYPGATWDRLAAVKAVYDPDNVFRGNHNVPPAG
ncbi:FAD linked oxidase domain protein [Xylanimonas cellulosilytica DSM 15894]|uniref:FAD linked oxidase domain protein n=1 Tax=Xylanimonas cellulosilytica (strain DSM 15894 / JCM 12276 / CECT 5975 / KCTC 9989 / LMG 20990 / NBRC 107835 / XIL07) TaxID=446471 RepID=D1BUF4_XYLCX|nr:FAD-binding oxidoreductase [Xylanimonas cellulosilytica]ACZ31167.1 FAD linked oxidase domain protein [Xylanimonas cellulosilytica DSM 15894]